MEYSTVMIELYEKIGYIVHVKGSIVLVEVKYSTLGDFHWLFNYYSTWKSGKLNSQK